MNKWLEIFTGLILLVASIYAWGMNFWGLGNAALTFLKGGIMWLLILLGLILLILGISGLKD
jgi:hypothetical protein